jgi:hypothetical protein
MSSRKSSFWRFAIVAAVSMLIASPFIWHLIHRIDPKFVEVTIAENLRPGVDVETVIRYLDGQGIRHSRYYPELRELYANIDQASLYGIKGRVHIIFHFDENQRLVSHEAFNILDFL